MSSESHKIVKIHYELFFVLKSSFCLLKMKKKIKKKQKKAFIFIMDQSQRSLTKASKQMRDRFRCVIISVMEVMFLGVSV